MNPSYAFLIASGSLLTYLILGLMFYAPFAIFFISRLGDYPHVPTWQRVLAVLIVLAGFIVWPLVMPIIYNWPDD